MSVPATLGPYPIERELGRGGMGVVYLGRDPRLQRQVAIKVLSGVFAQQPEHLARFDREAKLLASLNHPNIAAIHGVEATADGQQLLVLEYVPGDTLAERIARAPLPVSEAIDIARQIAAAVEVAHDGGIVHRDLKPGNVKITPDGQVKVLDFGLAKGTSPASDVDLAQSPTFTSVPTATGVILGTAGYMSPEQARGRPVDRRSDIWSFGCVLFECLTGRRLFDGETISDTIASILQREPDWAALPAATPSRLRDLLRRCLEKDLRRRQRDIGDVRLELEDLLAARSPLSASAAVPQAETTARRPPFVTGVAMLVGTAVVCLAAGWGLSRVLTDSSPRPVAPVRLTVTFPPDLSVRDSTLSPDGTRLVVRAASTAGTERTVRLYTRRLDEYDFTPIAGTDDVQRFVFSPDGRWLAVVVRVNRATGERRLTKIPVDGSAPPVVLAQWDSVWFDSFVWLDDDDLLLTRPDGADQVIFGISTATGAVGQPRKIDFATDGVLRAAGRTLAGQGLFVLYDTFGARGYQTDVWLLDPRTGAGTKVVENAAEAVYLDSGHLLFSRDDTIMAAPFDPSRRAITGEITALMSGLRSVAGPGEFDLAVNGTLTYATGPGNIYERSLVVVDQHGKVTPFVPDTGRFTIGVVLDRGGTRAVTTVFNQTATYETWVADASRSTVRRTIAVPAADVSSAIWSPNGQSLAYMRESLDEEDGLYVQALSGAGDARRLVATSKGEYFVPTSWLPDGSAIIVTKIVAQKRDVVIVPVATPGAPRALRVTAANEENALLSPDGSLVAYASDESGQMEIYVAPFADGTLGQGVPVSRGAGNRARWLPGSRRLYFSDTAGKLQVVDLTTTPALSSSAPQAVLDLETHRVLTLGWDVLADGRVVGIQRSDREDALPSINIVLNWEDEVRRRLAR